jgi:hypothetical protein
MANPTNRLTYCHQLEKSWGQLRVGLSRSNSSSTGSSESRLIVFIARSSDRWLTIDGVGQEMENMDRRPIDSRIQFSSPQAVVKGGCILPGSISRIKFAGGQIKFCSIWIPTPCVKENRCPRDFGRGCFDVASVTCRARQYPYCCCCRRCRRRRCCCCCCCNCRCRAWLLQLTKKTSAADVAR